MTAGSKKDGLRTQQSKRTDGNCSPVCANATAVPIDLRLTYWTCLDDCNYMCMHKFTEHLKAHGNPVMKYHGKWPFLRILGFQEIASSIFSVANLAAHLHGLIRLRRATRGLKHGYPYLHLVQFQTIVNVNAWVWSMVFHARDLPMTEALDYLSANVVLFSGILLIAARVLSCQQPSEWALMALPALAGLCLHMHYMLAVKFDYGWNMKLCLILGAVQALAWVIWSQWVQHIARWKFLAFFVGIHAGLLLEVLDFPPFLELFDAHSLWHAYTPPFVYMWYSLFISDAMWMSYHKQL
mmetsp:Transcript_33767/g.64597  ORF Transcript_33767/g.64597 Transcript_33767/m.64597 type:complete len:296 (+) Transcript_33767:3-890(+)